MWKLIYFYIFLFSFFSTLILVRCFRILALRYKIIDPPDLSRKIHAQAVPLLGGIAMYLAFLITVLINFFLVFSAFVLAIILAAAVITRWGKSKEDIPKE